MQAYRDSQFESEHYAQQPLNPSIPQDFSSPSSSCAQGHRASLILQTQQGGCICLLCFSNLISSPNSPTFHVSYALSQLSEAISQPQFLRNLLAFHVHVIVSPIVQCLASFDDEPIARQVIDLIVEICEAAATGGGGGSVFGEFVARVSDRLLSGALAWSRRQAYTLHCLGVLLNCQTDNPYTHIRDIDGLIYNLVMGLQLPSEEIRGEILFVLYRLSILQCASKDDKGADAISAYGPKLLHLALEALLKTQSDDVRLNCIALLKVLAQRGLLGNAFSSDTPNLCEADNFMQATVDGKASRSLDFLFAEAIKAPLLSPDIQVQIATVELIFHFLSQERVCDKQVQVLVEGNIVDYIFEILRLSGREERVVSSCILVLHLLSTVQQVFRQRLAIGFKTLVLVLPDVAEIPLHPIQTEMLKLILDSISNCPGVVSTKNIEGIAGALTVMLKRYMVGEMGMLMEAFNTACSIFVSLMKLSSSSGSSGLMDLVQQAARHAVLACLNGCGKDTSQLLHSLYLVKEACTFSYQVNPSNMRLRNSVLEMCQGDILPWFVKAIDELEEESILGVLEAFQSILAQSCDAQNLDFTKALLSFSWFSLSFKCLGLYPTERMKWRVYFMLGSIVDNFLGHKSGQSINEAAASLPSDPIDLLFLLVQKSTNNLELSLCQSAVLQILYTSSILNEMLADHKLVLSSLEQYILINGDYLLCGDAEGMTLLQLVNLYGLYRGLVEMSYQIAYSREAERIFFRLVTEKEWDMSSAKFHPTSLKWLFRQERISEQLSCQILKVCRNFSSDGTQSADHGNSSQNVDVKYIAYLVDMGDTFAPKCLVNLLIGVVEKDRSADNIILVLNFISLVINTVPSASDNLCKEGIGNALRILCCSPFYSFPKNYVVILRFILIVLSSVRPDSIFDDEHWLRVVMKLLDSLTSIITANAWTNEDLLVIGVLSLILNHSTYQALIGVSKFIMFNTSLPSMIRTKVDVACTNGCVSMDQDEQTQNEQVLVFLLLLNYCHLKSLQSVLPGEVDWQDFLDPPSGSLPFPSMGIFCKDFCRLLHYGSSLIKLIASYCLVELFKRITEQGDGHQITLKCSMGCFRSILAVLEGQVFSPDLRVSLNSGLCLSMVLGCKIPGAHITRLTQNGSWCRLMVEELVMSLAVPCSVSKSFMKNHKPGVHVAIALMKLNALSGWMRSAFDESCISGIIKNLSPSNITAEMVLLFRELMHFELLKPDQISSIRRVFQACKKRLHMQYCQDGNTGEHTRMMIKMSSDLRDICDVLVHLVLSESLLDEDPIRLSGEIDLFLRDLPEGGDV